jgi:hypothetical protein
VSRGDGRLQRAILGELSAATRLTTFENLRWKLWEALEAGAGGQLVGGQLPTKWNTSLWRALQTLTGRPGASVVIEKRRLSRIDEVVEHYPGKTLSVAVRSLRLALLPEIRRWAREHAPRYSLGMNERFHLENLPAPVVRRLQQAWHNLASTLVSLLPGLPGDCQNLLFLLIAKGKSVFEMRGVECHASFAELLKPCLEAGLIPSNIATQVSEFSRALLPPEEAGFLRIKSYVHKLANVARHGRCTLQPDTIEYLDSARPDIVRGLPGYEPPLGPSNHRWIHHDARPRHSQQLHSLIDHSIFQKFQFLTIA